MIFATLKNIINFILAASSIFFFIWITYAIKFLPMNEPLRQGELFFYLLIPSIFAIPYFGVVLVRKFGKSIFGSHWSAWNDPTRSLATMNESARTGGGNRLTAILIITAILAIALLNALAYIAKITGLFQSIGLV